MKTSNETFSGIVVELPNGKMALKMDGEQIFTAEKLDNKWIWNGIEIPNKNWVNALVNFERRKKLAKLLSQ